MSGVQRCRPRSLERMKRGQPEVVFFEDLYHSRLIWSRPDVIGSWHNPQYRIPEAFSPKVAKNLIAFMLSFLSF